jgi:hypothetical protein
MLPMPSDRVREILPPDTAATWDAIAPLVPSDAYLGGGTAIAVRLGHRISRDLDFFFHHGSVDLGELARRLSAAGPFAVTERASGTLNGVFSATKVQFLHADEGIGSIPGEVVRERPLCLLAWGDSDDVRYGSRCSHRTSSLNDVAPATWLARGATPVRAEVRE